MQKKIVKIEDKSFVVSQQQIKKTSFLFGSSFQRFLNNNQNSIDKPLSEINYELVAFAKRIVELQKIITIVPVTIDIYIPGYIKIIINIYLYLVKNFTNNKNYQNICLYLEKNPLKIKISLQLWKIILEIVQKKLIVSAQFTKDSYISDITVFSPFILDNVFCMISQQQSHLSIDSLVKFNNCKNTEIFGLQKYIYYFFGGSYLSISADNFKKNLTILVKFLKNYFEKGDNLVMKYLKSINQKKKDKENEQLQKYIQLATEYEKIKSKLTQKQYLNRYWQSIFQNKDILTSNEFNQKLISQSKSFQYNIFFKFFQIIKIEFYIVTSDSFNSITTRESNDGSAKYYLQSLEKLLNKCPYYGNQMCSCKKCQCVRRNRQSAKLSQQKKREALQMIGPLNEKIKSLETKNHQLQSQNAYLKNLLSNFTSHPNFYSIIQQNIEPLKKSLNN